MMKTVLMICCLAFAIQLSAQKIEFQSLEINYGELQKGDNGLRIFKFKNEGNAPLIISDVQKTCGCTSPMFTNSPVMPGESGEIQVKYDTQRVGAFTKFVTVHSNDPEKASVQLKIYGNIKETQPLPSSDKSLFSN